jgi:hypothetical protein
VFSRKLVITSFIAVALGGAAALTLDVDIRLKDARAEAAPSTGKWSPTKPNPTFDVYYPGTEALAPDDRVRLRHAHAAPQAGGRLLSGRTG